MLLVLYTVYGAPGDEESPIADFLLWYCGGGIVTCIA